MIIVKTEFDKIIGGFVPVKWSQNEYSQDSYGKSFLFSVTLKQKMMPIKSKVVFYTDNKYGFILERKDSMLTCLSQQINAIINAIVMRYFQRGIITMVSIQALKKHTSFSAELKMVINSEC